MASVSCIYGLGSPKEYADSAVSLRPGQEISRDKLLNDLVDIQFERNDIDFQRGKFRVRGDVVEIFLPAVMKMLFEWNFSVMRLTVSVKLKV